MKIKRVEHIAIAVDSLGQSIDLLKNTFGIALEYEEQIGQTRLAMLPVGETYLELLEGQGPDSGVTKWINEKGPGLFHICFEVEDIDAALAELKQKGVKLRDGTWTATGPNYVYTDGDGSTTPPVLNVSDFICFQQRFAAGCP